MESVETDPALEPLTRNSNTNYDTIANDETTYLLSVKSTITYKRRWYSIRVMYLTMFCGSVGFSVVFASLWPFLKKINHDVSPTFLGWANAAYSLAQLVGSVLFGFWCRHRPAKESLYFSILVGGIGSCLYTYAEEFPDFGEYVILIARVLLGFSAGSGAVTRTVTAQATSLQERNGAMANLALAQAIGFIIGPAFSALAVPLGDKSVDFAPLRLHFNVYTSAGIVSFVLLVINVAFALCYFREDETYLYGGLTNTEKFEVSDIDDIKPDMVAVVTSNILFFMTLTVFALNETIMTPLLMHEFAWSNVQTVLYVGIILIVLGAVACLVFIFIKPLLKNFKDNNLLSISLILILAGFIVFMPWGYKYPQIQMIGLKPQEGVLNYTTTTVAPRGCPSTYQWCFDTPQLYLAQYLVGSLLVGIGYPASYVIITAMYSKILGPRPQGTYNGWLGAVGSLARTIGPVLVTTMYVDLGPRWMFFSVAVFVTMAISISFLLQHRLVPYHEYVQIRTVRMHVTA